MQTKVSEELIEQLNYFGGKFSVIKEAAKQAFECLEDDDGADIKNVCVVNILSAYISLIYDEYSEFIRRTEYPAVK